MNEDSKNKDFVQIYRRHIDDIAKMAKDNGTAYELFMLLLKHMDGSNALCVSTNALSEILGVCSRTVMRSTKYLREHGWICVLKSGTTNVYVVNPEVAWTSYDNQKKYCKFNANVLLAASENAEYLKNPDATNHFKNIDEGFIKSVQDNKKEFKKQCENISKKGA